MCRFTRYAVISTPSSLPQVVLCWKISSRIRFQHIKTLGFCHGKMCMDVIKISTEKSPPRKKREHVFSRVLLRETWLILLILS